MEKKENSLNLGNYTLQELANLKKQFENDIQTMLNSYNGFKYVHTKTENDKVLIKNLSQCEEKSPEILVPLSNSLYLPGRFVDKDKFIVDIGTGYRAERNTKQLQEFLNHTSKIVVDNAEAVVKEIEKKKTVVDNINIEIQKKYASINQDQQKNLNTNENSFKKKQN
jgi:prefoldin alpha subunit